MMPISGIKFTGKGRWKFLLIFLIITILLVASLSLYLEIGKSSDAVVEGVEENLIWAVHQLERESYKVEAVTELLSLEPENEQRLSELRTSFDILYSRVKLLDSGEFKALKSSRQLLGSDIQVMDGLIKSMDKLLFSSTYPLDLATLLDQSHKVQRLSNELLMSGLEYMTVVKVERRNYLTSLNNYFALLMVFITISFALMVYLLVRQLRSIQKERKRALMFANQLKTKAHEARRASQAKSDFLSRMSHELRTPLNIINGFAQLLQSEEKLEPAYKQNVEEILGAGEHLLCLVNEILELTRIEAGKLDINFESVDVGPLLQNVVKQHMPLAQKRCIDIRIEPLSDNVSVKADSLRLKQVLTNLLSNAIKYNKEGGEVILTAESFNNGRLRINVADTGRGIEAQYLQRLFQPFERLESPYEAIEGTGIGLVITKRLVEAMSGEIGVESAHPDGSTFWFELEIAS